MMKMSIVASRLKIGVVCLACSQIIIGCGFGLYNNWDGVGKSKIGDMLKIRGFSNMPSAIDAAVNVKNLFNNYDLRDGFHFQRRALDIGMICYNAASSISCKYSGYTTSQSEASMAFFVRCFDGNIIQYNRINIIAKYEKNNTNAYFFEQTSNNVEKRKSYCQFFNPMKMR
jgi:hypothetical protein